VPDAQDMQYAQLAQKIATGGLPGVATIKSIGETGETDAGVNKQYAIDVSIELEAGDKYDTTVLQTSPMTRSTPATTRRASASRSRSTPMTRARRCSTGSPTN
jgi:hypothetical protein